MSKFVKTALAMWMLPVLVAAFPSARSSVLCIGVDGHVAIEQVCGGNRHIHSHDAHQEQGGASAVAQYSLLGHHVDCPHTGNCTDYTIFNDDGIENRGRQEVFGFSSTSHSPGEVIVHGTAEGIERGSVVPPRPQSFTSPLLLSLGTIVIRC